MKSFRRALRFSWPYRGRLALSIFCGFMVALFWGANISAVYPLLSVLLNQKTLTDWVDDRIKLEEKGIVAVDEAIATVRGQIKEHAGDPEPTAERQGELQRRESERRSRARYLGLYQWLRPKVAALTPGDSFLTLCFILAVVLVGMALKGLFDFLQEYLAFGVVQLSIFDLRNRLFRKTLSLDFTHFSDNGSHELMARLTNDVETLANGMKALYGQVLLEPLKAGSCLVFACALNWRLTLLALITFPAAAAVMGSIGRYLKRMSRRNLESMSRIYKILQESFLGIRVVKAFTMERYERRRLYLENKRYYLQAMRLNRTEAYGGPVLEFLAMLAVSIALLAGSYLVIRGQTHVWGVRLATDPIDPSMLLTFYALIAGVCDPLRKVFSVYGRVQRGVAAADRIFQCLDRENRVPDRPRAPELPRHALSIEFKDIGFSYGRDRTVLSAVNLKVGFGETIAIVGSTGSGKTSLVNLLPRFYDPTDGSILIDGVDVREASLRSLRQQMGIVTQQTMLFDDTIFNNIAYGHRFAERSLVEEAAKKAYAHRFITELPQGYDTPIGELGGALAGGQRQRIALARAILRDPSILILDEATSSLDVESESLIHKALRTFCRNRTTFIVTHRLGVLDIADRIVVIDNGRIEAAGTFNELLRSSPTFQRLQDVQAKRA
ncbi:MAG TPA: ABC transporter ATP-binding protein [Planctomycetia bacterium]|nr:ABC transporter ATP-binding protein [Planctomycetia bacterium]